MKCSDTPWLSGTPTFKLIAIQHPHIHYGWIDCRDTFHAVLCLEHCVMGWKWMWTRSIITWHAPGSDYCNLCVNFIGSNVKLKASHLVSISAVMVWCLLMSAMLWEWRMWLCAVYHIIWFQVTGVCDWQRDSCFAQQLIKSIQANYWIKLPQHHILQTTAHK